ncbi:TerC family protein [Rubrobacter indicoceani]|uniref:TerC family protein n=1 Tax=Rubrobacter indicoceani TaxID=2051957 RepID=UPI000E5B765E|nr:TerC family protein [Rubrobacter indicoceani]
MDIFSGELLTRFLGILLIDLILSGDNAVVIALAVRNLEGETRRKAIFWGAAGAITLRLLFAGIITYLLLIPLLPAVAALLLIWVAWKLLFQAQEDHSGVQSGASIWQAIRIIIVADVIMSLDNVVALVGVADGNFWLILVGILITIPLIIYGARILSSLMDRLPWLIYLGSGILIYVAYEMFVGDPIIHDLLVNTFFVSFERIIAILAAVAFIAYGYYRVRQSSRVPATEPRVK